MLYDSSVFMLWFSLVVLLKAQCDVYCAWSEAIPNNTRLMLHSMAKLIGDKRVFFNEPNNFREYCESACVSQFDTQV